jgi:hypothetical protein
MIVSSGFAQSAPLTYTLAALCGVLEVFATALLTYRILMLLDVISSAIKIISGAIYTWAIVV